MNDATLPLPSRALKTLAAVAKCALWLVMGMWLALALAWGALHGWIVPRIDEFRPAVQAEVTRALGTPVRIGSITAHSEGLVPSFELSQVVLFDAQGREALRLPRVLAALSPRSLWNLAFEQLYIDAPELDVRRTREGHVLVAGIDFSRTQDDGGRGADWFFSQREFVIRQGTLRWTDDLRGAPPLTLQNVDLVVRNDARRHAMRLDATPPPDWGTPFRISALLRQPLLSVRSGRWQDWSGEVHAEFARVDLAQLRRHADIGARVDAGLGAVRAWADVERGAVVGGTADVQLAGVNATLGSQLQPLALRQLSGRLAGKRLARGFELETRALQFETADGQRWPGGNVFVGWSDTDGRQPARGELRGDRLDLDALGVIASRLPLGTSTHAQLAALQPRGLVEKLQARWQGPLSAPLAYEAKGRATGLAIAAQPAPAASQRAGVPGVRGASIDFDLTQAGGKARVQLASGALELPGVFDEPVLPFDQLSADVQWTRAQAQLAVSVANLKFSNADTQGEGKASWRTGDAAGARYPGVLDLQATLARADGTRVWRYLPHGVPREAREYVRESVRKGRATAAKFRVRGDLREFPWHDGKRGEFLVTAKVHDVLFDYIPRSAQKGPGTWPALSGLDGELVFQGNGMAVRDVRGRVAGMGGLQVRAEALIPDFHTTTVAVTGLVRGPLAESLAVVQQSPLAGMTNNALAQARGTGNAEVRLQLDLPIARIERSRVEGTVTLPGNEVQITPDSPVLARARGQVTFNERGFALVGTQARALGGDVRLEGGTRALPGGETLVQLRAQGVATAEGLRQARELGFVSRIARDMQGSTAYTLALGFRRGTPELLVTSSLQGLALDLPPPLNKAADATLPLRYETALTRDSLAAGARLQDQLGVELGRVASVQYVRDLGGPEPRVLRGRIAVGAGAEGALPEDGVLAQIQLPVVNVDAWEDVLSRAALEPAATASAPRPSALRAGGGAPSTSYLPTALALRARELRVDNHTLHDVTVGGSRDGLVWRANVDARELNGYLEYHQPSEQNAGRVHARLARLNIASSDTSEVEAMLEQPASIPALDIVVDDFELRGKKLGRLEIDAVNRGAGREGVVREWRLNKLVLSSPDAVFNASGNWVALGAQGAARSPGAAGAERRRTAMRFRLDIADAGGLLARFGMKDVILRGRGRMEGDAAWIGSPLAFDYPSLSGAFHINVENGQFLKADAGMAKLLGVLSLQSLPRRLVLDFRDVFSQGFAFDFVRGDVTVAQGIASTNNLQMKGVSAAVLMEGKADIARETQDLKVVVVPEINAGTASLVATAINPAIGLGTFLAQMFLREPLTRAATREFQIDGTWSDPRVTRIGARAPAAAAAEASGAGATAPPTR